MLAPIPAPAPVITATPPLNLSVSFVIFLGLRTSKVVAEMMYVLIVLLSRDAFSYKVFNATYTDVM